MPTTIYDSSLITQRKRDKAIAQQIYRANTSGNPIIIPQAGYGSYYQGESKNGGITDYRKGCPPDVSCNCSSKPTESVPTVPTGPSIYILDAVITDLTVNIAIFGSGTIDWGDGTTESFDLRSEFENYFFLPHTYNTTGNYVITITGDVRNLAIGEGGFYFNNMTGIGPFGNPPNPYPTVTTITIQNPVGLLELIANNPGLLQINGLSLCTDLNTLGLANNSCSFTDALTLPNLITLILDNKPQITGSFDASIFPSSITYLSFGYTSIIGLTGLSSSLIGLGIPYCPSITSIDLAQTPSLRQGRFNNSPLTSLGTLPTTLFILIIENTLITGAFDISGLTQLEIFICDNTTINNLGTLPTTLTTLSISNTSITGTFDISGLEDLRSFDCSNTTINNLGTLPTSLIELNISNTAISGTVDISGLTLLENFDCYDTTITFIPMSGCTSINIFRAYNCNLNLTAANVIGNQLLLCPDYGTCNISNQTPAIIINTAVDPWNTLENVNGWTLTV